MELGSDVVTGVMVYGCVEAISMSVCESVERSSDSCEWKAPRPSLLVRREAASPTYSVHACVCVCV